HPEATGNLELSIPTFEKIGIALDFSDNDKKLISYAIAQGNAHATYVLMHVVESVSAKMLKHESDDFETKEDKKRLEHYKNMLAEAGYKAETQIGFDKRSDEIVRMAKATNCEMLVMGAHGHKGVEDFIHGETVDAVRHRIKIPVLIVNV
ncbi:MAG: universal stress protein, partial [Agriterribacter sp.]